MVSEGERRGKTLLCLMKLHCSFLNNLIKLNLWKQAAAIEFNRNSCKTITLLNCINNIRYGMSYCHTNPKYSQYS